MREFRQLVTRRTVVPLLLLLFTPTASPQVTARDAGKSKKKTGDIEPYLTRRETSVGRITEIDHNMIEYKPINGDPLELYMQKNTEILDLSSKRLSFSDLKVGDNVRVLNLRHDFKLADGTEIYVLLPLRIEKLPSQKSQ